MTLTSEVAALSALVRHLSEPWPAEERTWRSGWGDRMRRVWSGERCAQAFPHAYMAPEQWRSEMWRGRRRPARPFAQEQASETAAAPKANGRTTSRSWMPSIAGVGPIVFRWPAETVQPEPEAWRTYESIRAAIEYSGGTLRTAAWFCEVPRRHRSEAEVALSVAQGKASPWDDFDIFAQALADLLAPQPVYLPAVVKRIGALPRDWAAARDRRSERERYGLVRGPGTEDVGRWETPDPRCHRATLGTLAARYCARRPDGSYNRHDACRWMRRFRAVASVAGDAIERWGLAGRPTAIRTLLEVVGLDDAVRLTERPWPNTPARRTLAFEVDPRLIPVRLETQAPPDVGDLVRLPAGRRGMVRDVATDGFVIRYSVAFRYLTGL